MTTVLGDEARAAVAGVCEVADPVPTDGVDGVVPGLVARPTTTAQVAEVLRAAAGHGLSVVPRGTGTKLAWGRPPTTADVLLDLAGMDRVLDHAAGDLIVAAEAGTPLARVQEHVAPAGQRLLLDETVPGATVGGTLATAASGPHRLVAGTPRDLLIGLTVVRADGVVAKAGGRVVKNVAGYDLGKLAIGSYGTLAVVTETVFRLHPRPAASRWLSVPVATPEEATRLTIAALDAGCAPAALDVDWPPTGGGVLTVLLEGREAGVEGRVAALRSVLGESAVVDEDPPAGWGEYPWDPAATGGERATALKLTFALSGLTDVLGAARGAGAEHAVRVRGSAGTGVVHAALPGTTPVEAVSGVVGRLREACRRRGGAAVVLDAPSTVKDAVDTWGPVDGLALMRRVKDQFDPDHRLSPGRFVGGI